MDFHKTPCLQHATKINATNEMDIEINKSMNLVICE